MPSACRSRWSRTALSLAEVAAAQLTSRRLLGWELPEAAGAEPLAVAVAEAVAELEERPREVVFEGISSVLSANTTSCPASIPEVICTQPPPTTPVLTSTVVAVVAASLSTVSTVAVPVPVGVTAEAGNRTTLDTEVTGMVTAVLEPANSWPSGSVMVAVVE